MNKAVYVLKKVKHKTRIRTRYRDAKKKAASVGYIYRNVGISGVKQYIKSGIKKRIERKKAVDIRPVKDVLMITIDDELLDRYRTDHMIEEFESVGVSVDKISYYNLTPEMSKRYNTFIFYRSPWLPQMKQFFEEVRRRNKPTVYAIDDLVIDRKYTDTIPAIQEMNRDDRKIYDDGVERHKKLMEHCDYAITTTEDLASELKNYKNLKEIFINRNAMSSEMIAYSDKAIKTVSRPHDRVVIGYFSGTNTHNEDYQMISHALINVLKKYDNVYLKLAGRIDAPEELKDFKDRMIFTPYVDWKKLPFELREADIILAPLVDNLFNRAKSEIKWSEASLVEVPVVASNIGSFKTMIKDGETGILTENTVEAWTNSIEKLVLDRGLRESIGNNARIFINEHLTTTGRVALDLRDFVEKITPPVIGFVGVSIGAASGGNLVIKEHMRLLREAGNIVYGIETMNYKDNDQWLDINRRDDKQFDFFRINSFRKEDKVNLEMSFDRLVATFWQSVDFVDYYKNMRSGSKKLYLVQNMEAGFYEGEDRIRRRVYATYSNRRIEPITISKWCKEWLKNDFNRDAKYAPNGIHVKDFPSRKHDLTKGKVKILIEGDSSSNHKKVDESFRITNKLDKSKYHIEYMSNNGKPKEWYEFDKVYLKVPYDKVGEVYSKNDILVKSSILESFSYPPIEMMATGGVVVLAKNGGNAEYVRDHENAIYYDPKDLNTAVKIIKQLTENDVLYNKLSKNGIETAKQRDWSEIKDQVLDLYL